jgi:plasmid stabilization system protein ParE
LIAAQPEMGEARPQFGAACRVFSFKRQLIILYRPAIEGIEVLRFVDGTRDYERLV